MSEGSIRYLESAIDRLGDVQEGSGRGCLRDRDPLFQGNIEGEKPGEKGKASSPTRRKKVV